ncbi:hypothetical protein [Seonamhaeicola maritimus]|uniref:DUF1735 domain-containing protein n=1 Tax=Seonamhaeicola maritimus TaxID=2591822 RepID=A0A5C7GLG5_9FLAO|nr:hypothetical protein [Seonamhaeicola maritimus]TXG38791.1 hypothetical protein FUA22_02585 [Seonamhaeicola maritimus]
MKRIITLCAIMLSLVVFTNCEKNDDTPAILDIDYVGLESGFTIGVDPTGTASQEVQIATSNTASTPRMFNIAVDTDLTTADASAYSVPSSVTVPANSNVGMFSIDVVGPNVSTSGNDILAIGFTSPDDGLFISDPISLNLKQVCPQPETILDFTFDDWPEEIYWVIEDAGGNALYESAPGAYGAYDGLEGGITRSICLAPGDYTFTIYDRFADGAGPYTISQGGTVLVSSDGLYGPGEARSFTVSGS